MAGKPSETVKHAPVHGSVNREHLSQNQKNHHLRTMSHHRVVY